jgi:ABC-type multidrug transport system fused ATPase/permease subunit
MLEICKMHIGFSSVLQRFSTSSTGANSDVSDAIAEVKGVQPKRGMILPFQPLTIAFHHINYFIDMPAEMKEQGVTEDKLQLLNDITGAFRPGILTALVGVSGAGKTTFMDVLAGRKTGGYIEGSIYISGHPKKQETFARIAGYCEQFDIHSPNVTVHESLLYSAWLRLSKDVNTEVRRVIKTMSTYFACLLYYILAFLLGNCACGFLLITICLDGTFGNFMWGFC